jgi:hypothetical protein
MDEEMVRGERLVQQKEIAEKKRSKRNGNEKKTL